VEKKLQTHTPENKTSSSLRGVLALAFLGLSAMACKSTDILTSPDPAFSFLRGATGALLIELELGVGKPIKRALFEAPNGQGSCGTFLLATVFPAVVGAVSLEYPAVGYVALALPVLAAAVHTFGRH